MRLIVHFFLLLFIINTVPNTAESQPYHWGNRQYADANPIEPGDAGKNFMKGYSNNLRLYHLITDSVTVKMVIKNIDLNTLLVNDWDTVVDFNLNFFYTDIVAM